MKHDTAQHGFEHIGVYDGTNNEFFHLHDCKCDATMETPHPINKDNDNVNFELMSEGNDNNNNEMMLMNFESTHNNNDTMLMNFESTGNDNDNNNNATMQMDFELQSDGNDNNDNHTMQMDFELQSDGNDNNDNHTMQMDFERNTPYLRSISLKIWTREKGISSYTLVLDTFLAQKFCRW